MTKTKDFAEGLPSKYEQGDLSTLPVDEIVTLVRQRHNARKAGLHEDLRIGTPEGMFSWAVPKFLPEEPVERRLAVRQPLHRWSYNEYEGLLGPGYGEGEVSRIEKSPVVITKKSPGHIAFTRGDKKNAPTYNLIHTGGDNWLVSVGKQSQPDVVKKYKKEHFKSIPVEAVPKMVAEGAVLTPKIDGAGALLYMGKKGPEVYGIRDSVTGEKPSYTDIIGGLRGYAVPDPLRGRMFRGELYGIRGGTVIPPNELAGVLNSTLLNAVGKRQSSGLRLMMALLAEHKKGQDVYDTSGVGEVVKLLRHPAVAAVPGYEGKEASKLLSGILSGKNKLTSEGVVVHAPGKRPLKAKAREDYDVVIRDIFKADTQGDNRAGGFSYSLPGRSDIVGRVGTGFSHDLLRDMLRNPELYKGKTARIYSQGQYPTGAYRAPSFISLKED